MRGGWSGRWGRGVGDGWWWGRDGWWWGREDWGGGGGHGTMIVWRGQNGFRRDGFLHLLILADDGFHQRFGRKSISYRLEDPLVDEFLNFPAVLLHLEGVEVVLEQEGGAAEQRTQFLVDAMEIGSYVRDGKRQVQIVGRGSYTQKGFQIRQMHRGDQFR